MSGKHPEICYWHLEERASLKLNVSRVEAGNPLIIHRHDIGMDRVFALNDRCLGSVSIRGS